MPHPPDVTIRSRTRAPLTVRVPQQDLRPVWAVAEASCAHFHVPIDLWLAVVCVETALQPQSDGHSVLRVLSPRMAARFYIVTPTPAAIETSIGHLACQLERFPSLAAALAAYHFDPEWIADPADTTIDSAASQCFTDAVLTTARWVCQTQPWRAWAAPSADIPGPSDTAFPTSPENLNPILTSMVHPEGGLKRRSSRGTFKSALETASIPKKAR